MQTRLFLFHMSDIKIGFPEKTLFEHAARLPVLALESGGLNYAEYVAILSGNVDLLEKCKIERGITVLESERKAFMVSKNKTERLLQNEIKELNQLENTLEKLTSDWEKFEKSTPLDKKNNRLFELEINGCRSNFFDETLAKEIVHLKENLRTEGKYSKIGYYHNFEIYVKTNTILSDSIETPDRKVNKFYVKGENYYTFNNGNIGSTPTAIFSYFPNALEKIPGLINEYRERIVNKEESIQTCNRIISSVWNREEELIQLKSDLRLLDTKISASIKDIPDNTTESQDTISMV